MDFMVDPFRHWGCRINDCITWNNHKAILIQNEFLQIVVLVSKGTEIVQFLYKPKDTDFLWHSMNPPRDTHYFVPAGSFATTPFFDHWSGGWFEVLPNGGPPSNYKGAELGTFAETVNLPWEYRILDDSPSIVKVGFWVKTYRTPLLVQKTLTLKSNQPVLYIEEKVTNIGGESVDFMWGHHPVVGAPFLDETCRISAPASQVEIFHDEDGPDYRMGLHQLGEWPIIKDRNGFDIDLRTMPPKSNRTMDNCYLKNFTEGWISIQNQDKNVGFGLAWDPKVFQYIWLWQALGGGIGYPWYGRTYNIGLEPWSSYPCSGLENSIKNGTAVTLQSNESIDVWLTAVAFTDKIDVTKITRDGSVA